MTVVSGMFQPDVYDRLRAANAAAGWPEPDALALYQADLDAEAYAEPLEVMAARGRARLRRPRRERVRAPSAAQVHQMRHAAGAWAHEGAEMFTRDVGERMAATGEDRSTSHAYVRAQTEWHLAKALDTMREEDPDKAAELVTFMHRMCAELGVPVPYPFT